MSKRSATLHATCVAIAGKGILITGPSGSGKSALALQLIPLGAVLVADDRTHITCDANTLFAAPPNTIAGMIEARGVGIITVPYLETAPVALAIDMDRLERERLPLRHSMTVLDITLPCLHKVDAPYFPAAIYAYLKGS
ncbi:HPr kinase/phosphatase C-terminal domain-containing protein [Sulfitobacter sp. F26169L]|uniref:HPr kinase/phosphorylase n=1 Tax=Sulfitobacter sp. F26169L TaxID=2996015 RepID=UPI002260E1F2|nr:HPr kinase/phosphatase C-terminal domain-containing protein [Sulfitobacter sp. F26169L]MCX7566786.1 HPr kinase/phosphatase C-terminal domain-containing protein [Sulfitobacter sp. F26169L]